MTYQAPKNGFRTFVIIWATQSVSVFGSAMTLFAINIWLAMVLYPAPEQKSQLAGALAALNLSWALPALVAAPLAGAWADRHDRKHTMMVADSLSGLLSLLLTILMALNRLELWMVLVAAVLYAVLGAFHGAAFDTSYAMLVPDEQLPRANGMMQTMWALSNILSPAAAAVLIAIPAFARQGAVSGALGHYLGGLADGTPLAIGVDAVTFLLAAAVLPFLQVPSPKRADLGAAGTAKQSIWADVRTGAVYIWRRRPLLWLLGTFAVANLCSQEGIYMPLIVKFNLAADWSARGYTYETALAMLNTVISLGGLIAGLVVSAWGGLKRRRVYGVVVPLLLGGLAQAAIGFSGRIYLTAGIAFLLSAHIPFANVHSQTIWQGQTPRELQGRVFAVRRVIAQFTGPFSMALAGWLGGLFSPALVFAIFGGVLAAFCLAQLFNPHLLRVEDREYLEQLATAAEAH